MSDPMAEHHCSKLMMSAAREAIATNVRAVSNQVELLGIIHMHLYRMEKPINSIANLYQPLYSV